MSTEHDARQVADAVVSALSAVFPLTNVVVDEITNVVTSAIRDFAYVVELAKVARDTNPMRTNWDDQLDAATATYEIESMRAVLAKLEADGRITDAPGDHPHTAWEHGYNAGYRDRMAMSLSPVAVPTPNPYGKPEVPVD